MPRPPPALPCPVAPEDPLVTRSATLAALAAGLFLTAPAARAGLLPTGVTVTPDGGNFRWTYAVTLPTDTKLQAGDYFTVYDFGGLVPGSASAPAGWTLAVNKFGPTPDRVNPLDDPTIPNLTWTYHGPTVTGQLGLGNFWADSLFQKPGDSFFTALTPRAVDGQADVNITETTVPVVGEGPPPIPTPTPTPPGVPEPTTLALAGIGLALAGAVRRTRG
jgi:hypothetical protein